MPKTFSIGMLAQAWVGVKTRYRVVAAGRLGSSVRAGSPGVWRLQRGALDELDGGYVVIRRAGFQQPLHQRAAHGPVVHPDGRQRRVEQFRGGQVVVADDRDAGPDRER